MGWIIAIVIGYFVLRALFKTDDSYRSYTPPPSKPISKPIVSPPTVKNVRDEIIEIAKPRPKKRIAQFDDSLPDNLQITEEFQEAFDILNTTNKSIFITGKAGTGKSTLLKYFKKNTNKNYVVLAPTGIAALQVGGQTIHSFFRFPPQFIKPETIFKDSERVEIFSNVDTIIIDEISMVRADLMEGIDKSLKAHRGNNLPFGGAQMVFFGDLFQLPPVVVGDDLKNYFDEVLGSPYFFSARALDGYFYHKVELKKIFRQEGDLEFIDILNKVRKNQIGNNTLPSLNRRVVPGFQPQKDDLFVTLCATNKVADTENVRRLEFIDEKEYHFDAIITGNFDRKSVPTAERLSLKVGAQVMLLKNDSGKQYVNGSIGKIKKLDTNKIVVEVNGASVILEKAEWEQVEYKYDKETKKIEPIVVGTYSQYPLKLAWAITIHKSQGQTFDQVVIDLGYGAFAHGQTYVALSRCTSLNGIVLKQSVRWQDIIVDKRVIDFMN
jgi:hypothetical protein